MSLSALTYLCLPPSSALPGGLTSWQLPAHGAHQAASGSLPATILLAFSPASCDAPKMSATTDAPSLSLSAGLKGSARGPVASGAPRSPTFPLVPAASTAAARPLPPPVCPWPLPPLSLPWPRPPAPAPRLSHSLAAPSWNSPETRATTARRITRSASFWGAAGVEPPAYGPCRPAPPPTPAPRTLSLPAVIQHMASCP